MLSSRAAPHTELNLLCDPADTRSPAEQFASWIIRIQTKINTLYHIPNGQSLSSIILDPIAFAAHVPPPIPVPLAAPGGNQAENAYQLSSFIQNTKQSDAWVLALAQALQIYMAEIHPFAHPILIQAMGGAPAFLNANVLQLHTAAVVMCATKPTDIARCNADLRRPLVIEHPQSFNLFWATARERHGFLDANGAGHTEEGKISLMIPNIEASAHAHAFAQTINTFAHTHPVIGAPGRTLAALCQQLAIDAAMLEAAPRAYAAKALPVPSPSLAKPSKRQPRKQEWCWSHGKCFHTSKQCTTRAPGHMEAATQTNQLGSTLLFADPRWQT